MLEYLQKWFKQPVWLRQLRAPDDVKQADGGKRRASSVASGQVRIVVLKPLVHYCRSPLHLDNSNWQSCFNGCIDVVRLKGCLVASVFYRIKDVLKTQAERDMEVIKSYAVRDGIKELEWWDIDFYSRVARDDTFRWETSSDVVSTLFYLFFLHNYFMFSNQLVDYVHVYLHVNNDFSGLTKVN